VTASAEVLKRPPFVAAFLFAHVSVLGPWLATTEDSRAPLRTTNWSGFWWGWGDEVTTSWPIWVCRLSGTSAKRPVPDGRAGTFATAEANSFISRTKLGTCGLSRRSCRHRCLPQDRSILGQPLPCPAKGIEIGLRELHRRSPAFLRPPARQLRVDPHVFVGSLHRLADGGLE